MKSWILAFCGLFLSVVSLHSQTLDPSFNPGASSTVFGAAVQPDGAILATGQFLKMGPFWRFGMARLKTDGSVDPFFNPSNLGVFGTAIQPDGKIIVAGIYTNLAGHACTNLGRLNIDGTFDSTFSALADSTVISVMPQPDGRILVSGLFSNLDGQPCTRIGRLNSNGSVDTSFNASANSYVRSFALQPDGKILVGGNFTNLDGEAVNYIGRLNSDGSLDHSFNSSANDIVLQLTVQSNNMVLVGGDFTALAGVPRNYIGRLNTDGSIDPTFNPGASDRVWSFALQANGKILVGGDFTNLASVARNRVGRLNPTGTSDSTFNPGANETVRSVVLQPDGKVLVGGDFTNLAGGLRYFLGRLTNNDAAMQSLTFNASSVTWLRSGSCPEISGARFAFTTNGKDWTSLGDGVRVSGGWQASGLSIPSNASVRAWGYLLNSGSVNGTASVLQQIAGAPLITQQPLDTESVSNSNATLFATVLGTLPLSYQWQFNGTNLINGPKVVGATNTSLVLSNVTITNIGMYSLVVTNSFGAITSAIASLKVVVPNTNNYRSFQGSPSQFKTAAFQSDGKTIVEGYFPSGGYSFGAERVNFDGSQDTSFLVTGGNAYDALLVLPDGDILIGASGAFTNLLRVHPDGSQDAFFTNRPAGDVNAMALQPDGRILVAGRFSSFGNQAYTNIARLNADGSVDANFNAATDLAINSLALQANGQIIIAGQFTNVNGVYHQGLARLNSNGTLDPTFTTFFTGTVNCVAAQPDGRILVTLSYGNMGGVPWDNFMARLNPDDSLDTTFNATVEAPAYTIALQSDGKALVGGDFSSLNGVTNTTHSYFSRIKPDGTTDPTFGGGANGVVRSLGIQFDGGILVAGFFGGLYDGTSSSIHSDPGYGHLKNNEPVSHLISYDGSTVTWTRTGPAPECSWVLFEASPDGTNWSSLGAGVYTNRNWQLGGVSVPPSSIIRARGYVVGGYHNGSGWMIEVRSGPPFFIANPTGVTNVFNSTLAGWATGTLPIAYQWLKNGVAVTNYPSGQVAGAQTSSLFIKSADVGEFGHYQLVASNAFGSVTSSVAIVSSTYPMLDSQPFTIITNAGATVSFPVTTLGTAPISYQWFNGTLPLTNGVNISGATNSTLMLSNLTVEDSGSYWLVATNVAGTLSNLMATLTVTNSAPVPIIVSGTASFDRVINGFGFDLTAPVGQTVVIESSTNLIDWQPVLTNEINSNPLHFQDSSAITNRKAFYRVRLQ